MNNKLNGGEKSKIKSGHFLATVAPSILVAMVIIVGLALEFNDLMHEAYTFGFNMDTIMYTAFYCIALTIIFVVLALKAGKCHSDPIVRDLLNRASGLEEPNGVDELADYKLKKNNHHYDFKETNIFASLKNISINMQRMAKEHGVFVINRYVLKTLVYVLLIGLYVFVIVKPWNDQAIIISAKKAHIADEAQKLVDAAPNKIEYNFSPDYDENYRYNYLYFEFIDDGVEDRVYLSLDQDGYVKTLDVEIYKGDMTSEESIVYFNAELASIFKMIEEASVNTHIPMDETVKQLPLAFVEKYPSNLETEYSITEEYNKDIDIEASNVIDYNGDNYIDYEIRYYHYEY